MAPRLSNVPSQYQVHDMYEFSAIQNPTALVALQARLDVAGDDVEVGAAHPDSH